MGGANYIMAVVVALLACHAAAGRAQHGMPALRQASNATWGESAPMLEARAFVGASYVDDTQQVAPGLGGLIAVGGGNGGGGSLSSSEVYYPYTGGWRPQATLNVPRTALATAAIYQTIFAFGGLDNSATPLAGAEAYVPIANGGWEVIADMPDTRAFAGAAAVDGLLYVVGGENASGAAAKVLIYDPAADEWSSGASMPTPRTQLAVAAAGGLVYALGGADADGLLSSACEVYDPTSDLWASCRALPYAASALGAAAVDDAIVVAGGYNGGALDRVAVYNTTTSSWGAGMLLPTATYGCAMTTAGNGKLVFVVGGSDSDGMPLATLQTLTL